MSVLGVLSDPSRCRRFTPDVAVHWFPPGSVAGDACYCGETRQRDDSCPVCGAPDDTDCDCEDAFS